MSNTNGFPQELTLGVLGSSFLLLPGTKEVTFSARVGESAELESEEEEGGDSASLEMESARDLSLACSSAARRSSSEVTRDWILSSRFEVRVVSDCSSSC